MNAFGEINRLTRISCPTIGVLTNVHPAHTEGVGDIAGVARAKGELLKALDHGAVLIYNADDPWVARLAQDFRGPKLSFGLNAAAHLRATDRQTRGRDGQTARLSHAGQDWPLTLPVPGLHMLYNALAATAVGLSLGMAPGDTAAALERFRPIHRRSQVETLSSGVNLINDCYNANPGSMAMALGTLMELRDHGRAVAALGDMLELGAGRRRRPPGTGPSGRPPGIGPARGLWQLSPGGGRRGRRSRPGPGPHLPGGVPGRGRPDLAGTPGPRGLAPGKRLS